MKKFYLFNLIVLFLMSFLFARAGAENFYITDYDININVSSNKTVHVVENIDAYFTRSSHGIFRTIPVINNIEGTDGNKYEITARVSNVKVNEQFSTSFENSNYKIKIGNPDLFVSGKHRYVIEYDYEIKPNKNSKREFYYNILGSGWNTNINRVHFKVTMPKPFDETKTGLSMGKYGQKGFSGGMEYKINPHANTIEGYTTKTLPPNSAITLRIEVNKNYFLQTISKEKTQLMFLIPFITLIVYFLWYLFGKDDKVIPVVNFYPIEGISSAEMGVMYRGSASTKDIVSLIIYMASKGYIKIINHKNSFILEKIKDYEGKKEALIKLMNALFNGGNLITKEELEVSRVFYLECEKIIKTLNKVKDYIFEKTPMDFLTRFIPIVSIIALVGMLFYIISDYSFSFVNQSDFFILLFPAIATIIVVSAFCKSKSKTVLIPIVIWSVFFGGMPALTLFNNYKGRIDSNLDMVLLDLLAIIICSICLYQMPKRNNAGNLALGNILGFKRFIETAEVNKLKHLIKENPAYCFDILPYAYVLDVFDEWINKFESIVNYNPSWYTGDLTPRAFRSLTRSINSVSIPSISNGGISTSSSSSGRGGFSGGGCGGGGGGSW